MSTLCYSVELLSPLPIRPQLSKNCTVDAGSFFGFGPLFLGAVGSDQVFSPFRVEVDMLSLAPDGTMVESDTADGELSLFELGKGQLFPP